MAASTRIAVGGSGEKTGFLGTNCRTQAATLLERKLDHRKRAVAEGAAIQRPVEVRRPFLTCAVHDLGRPCQAIRGMSEWRRVELACAVVAFKGFHDLSPTRRHTRSFFHHQGCRAHAGMKVSPDCPVCVLRTVALASRRIRSIDQAKEPARHRRYKLTDAGKFAVFAHFSRHLADPHLIHRGEPHDGEGGGH